MICRNVVQLYSFLTFLNIFLGEDKFNLFSACTYTQTHIHTRSCICMHVYTHTHTDTHIRIIVEREIRESNWTARSWNKKKRILQQTNQKKSHSKKPQLNYNIQQQKGQHQSKPQIINKPDHHHQKDNINIFRLLQNPRNRQLDISYVSCLLNQVRGGQTKPGGGFIPQVTRA